MSVKLAMGVFSPGSRVFIIALLFNITLKSLPGDRSPQQQRNLALTCSFKHSLKPPLDSAVLSNYNTKKPCFVGSVLIQSTCSLLLCKHEQCELSLKQMTLSEVCSANARHNREQGRRFLVLCEVRGAEPYSLAQVRQAR